MLHRPFRSPSPSSTTVQSPDLFPWKVSGKRGWGSRSLSIGRSVCPSPSLDPSRPSFGIAPTFLFLQFPNPVFTPRCAIRPVLFFLSASTYDLALNSVSFRDNVMFFNLPPPAGMGADLLESIFVPAAAAAAATEGAAAAQAAASEEENESAASSSSQPRESYNVLLMEKLLRMLYASCQYGEQSRRLCAADGISRFSFKMRPRPRPPMLGGRARHIPATYGIWLQGNGEDRGYSSQCTYVSCPSILTYLHSGPQKSDTRWW